MTDFTFARTDTSLVSRWWWTIDRWILAAVFTLVGIGAVLTLAASPAVAERIGLAPFHFAHRQFVYLPLAALVMLLTSMLAPRGVRRLAIAVFVAALALLVLTPFLGHEIKGAVRWIRIAGISLQPSEFVKPAFAVLVAWVLAERLKGDGHSAWIAVTGLYAVVAGLLLIQPDVGMTIVVSAIWGVQLFLAGLPIVLVVGVGLFFAGGGVAAYFTFDHVHSRVSRFFDADAPDSYQVIRAMEAFRDGGFLGLGPGEGRVKSWLPDAHTDMIFAVAGEEFGLVACLVIVGLFAFVVLRGFTRVFHETDPFVMLATAGLLVQFGLQTLINLASTTNLMPPKGMTLPFISYGGSSMIALALGMGMVLALTRERPGTGGSP